MSRLRDRLKPLAFMQNPQLVRLNFKLHTKAPNVGMHSNLRNSVPALGTSFAQVETNKNSSKSLQASGQTREAEDTHAVQTTWVVSCSRTLRR